MIADRNQEDLILTIRMLDDDGSPITGLAWNTPTWEVEYKPYRGNWTPVTLQAGTLGTWSSGGFVESPELDGLYELGAPNASRISGHRTLWRFKFAANNYRYDSVDYTSIPSAETSSVKFEFAIPGVDETFTTDAELFIKEQGREVTFTANQDVSAIPLVIVFEDGDGVDKFIIQDEELQKTGDTVVATLPVGFTENEIALNWGIRNRDNERVYGAGTINVTYAPYVG
jgi:hypothetical protein